MLAALILSLLSSPAMAREGMWRPFQLPEISSDLEQLGASDVDPVALSSLDAAPLGAVVSLSRCTGAFVSEDGLIATSYHCIADGLQFASRPGEDLFEDGFAARTRDDERWAGPAEHVRVTQSVEDVTSEVLAGTKKLEGIARHDRVEDNIKHLVARCESRAEVRCQVAAYDHGAEYELIQQLELRDVRLVYAPPRAVGYFGGDDDNWQWPRHSGDFAFLRAYGRDGAPALHSPSNTAWHTDAFLSPAHRGPEPGEFVMTAGFPAGTWRWQTAAELDYAEQFEYPMRVAINREVEHVLQRWSDHDADIATKVAPRLLSVRNELAWLEGTMAGLERNHAASRRWQLDRDLEQWIASDPRRTRDWGSSVSTLHRVQVDMEVAGRTEILIENMRDNVAMLEAAVTLYTLAEENRKPDKQRRAGFQARDLPELQAGLDEVDAHYDWRVDRDLLRYFLLEIMALPDCELATRIQGFVEQHASPGTPEDQVAEVLDELYRNVDLADPMKRRSLMETSPWYLTRSTGNPWFELTETIYPMLERLEERRATREAERTNARRGYMEALRTFFPEARPRYVTDSEELAPGVFYSDANDTLRVSVGRVDGYFPRDGLIAEPRTRLEGILQRAGARPYDAPDALISAITSGRQGTYASPELGTVSVDYVTTLDTARGSSGSPTINAQGEFIGLVFDGNYESIASDWLFDPDMTRTIHTDVAYILWYLDAVAHADALLRELGKEPEFAGSTP